MTTIDRVDGRSLRSGFLANAGRVPDAPALVIGGTTRSYGQLEERARRWAGAIVQHLGRPPGRVGVYGQRSETIYTGVLAALLGGGAFVPLSSRVPAERTRAMIRSTELDALVADSGAFAQLDAVFEGLERVPLVLSPDASFEGSPPGGARVVAGARLEAHPPLSVLPPVLEDDLAYVMFTSGSTGRPKAIPITHRNVTHVVDAMTRRYGITAEDRFSQTFEHTFDLSVFDLFVAWESAACVYVLAPVELLAPGPFVARHQLTVWFSVPSIPALMRKKNLLRTASFPSLRWSLFCGEALSRATAESWQAAAPNSIVENLYGPTELTIACFAHRWDPDTSPGRCLNDTVPIGRPLPGLGAVVVDGNLAPVAAHESGELCVCGPQTAPGYWKDPSQTAERFVTLPVDGLSHVRFYRTGDLVTRHDNGEYAYLGRIDDQIKVLGHRVEPAEVEGALRRLPGVDQAVALGWPIREGIAEGIVAVVTGGGLEPAELRAACRRRLPGYMVPREVLVVDDLPVNTHGKVDRAALRRQLDDTASPVATGGRS